MHTPERAPPRADRNGLPGLLRAAGLSQGDSAALSLQRIRCGRGFLYRDETGARVADPEVLARIGALAIPPAYTDVRIAADPRAHLQAVGRDEAGRLQYRYHPGWEAVREHGKAARLGAMVGAIATIRRRVARDLRAPAGSPAKALAAVVALIDRSHIRIGCEDYLHTGRSRGAATLLKRNVALDGDRVRLSFRAKGGRRATCTLRAPALAAALAELAQLPGQRLFRYRGANGRLREVTASEVNGYLNRIAPAAVSAKDFRTLAASAEAAARLAELEPATSARAQRRQVAGVVREVAEILGNTPAVARRSYVHHRVVDAFRKGSLRDLCADAGQKRALRRGEALLHALFATESRPGAEWGRGSG
jgi:DNA topoisomerase-1